jgi:hypothetical protein
VRHGDYHVQIPSQESLSWASSTSARHSTQSGLELLRLCPEETQSGLESERPKEVVAKCDDQYAKGDFKTKHIFQLKDEGIIWARGWGQSTDVLMAAYTLAGSDW